MITRFVRVQLVIFTVLTIVAALLIALVYVRVPSLLGLGHVSVTGQFPAAGGIYPNANVTARGVTVGKVTGVRLVPAGVEVDMSIDASQAPAADSRAEIRSVSAIGEQYVDLIGDDGPAFADGDVIPLDRTNVPVPIADVLDTTDTLLTSVPNEQLSVLLDQADKAFRDIGPDLGRLVDDTAELTRTAQENYDQTVGLLNDFPRFAAPQLASSDAIRSWASDLGVFTDQLRASDGSLRSILTTVPGAATKADDLISSLGRSVPDFLDTTGILTHLAEAYHAPIEQVLVIYPMIMAAERSAAPPGQERDIRLNIQTNVNPPACNYGWVPPGKPGGARNAYDTADEDLPANSYCQIPQNDPTLARGARNLPCFEPGSPPGRRAALIQECVGDGFRPTTLGHPRIDLQTPVNDQPVFAEPLAGVGGTSDNQPITEEETWEGLLLPTPARP
ncbi:MCE family protein [Pseudonocardia sp. RS010]|uniref:MCE family protein n=1 Tax=Pseudonocardia sp. RS010 TaxID=3385979 RepID=UPI0039A0CCB6